MRLEICLSVYFPDDNLVISEKNNWKLYFISLQGSTQIRCNISMDHIKVLRNANA